MNLTKEQIAQMATERVYVMSENEIASAFTEWERRYRENPEQFLSEAEKLLKKTPKTYGDSCAPYFIKIHCELRAA